MVSSGQPKTMSKASCDELRDAVVQQISTNPRLEACMTPEPFVTADEVAQYLNISRRHVLEMARKNILPGHPVSTGEGRRTWRFKISEVERAILSRTARSAIKEPVLQTRPSNTITPGSPRGRKEQSNA